MPILKTAKPEELAVRFVEDNFLSVNDFFLIRSVARGAEEGPF